MGRSPSLSFFSGCVGCSGSSAALPPPAPAATTVLAAPVDLATPGASHVVNHAYLDELGDVISSERSQSQVLWLHSYKKVWHIIGVEELFAECIKNNNKQTHSSRSSGQPSSPCPPGSVPSQGVSTRAGVNHIRVPPPDSGALSTSLNPAADAALRQPCCQDP